MNLEYIISKNVVDLDSVYAIYPYGSRVYGNAMANSDYDYIVITRNKVQDQYSDRLVNINFFTPEEHQQRLNDHEISALECYFLPQEIVLFDRMHPLNKNAAHFKFDLDLVKLRHSLSAKSSNSWVKAKKKLTVEKDYDLAIGKKSLFHAIRIIEYGMQIARNGRLVDYSVCNDLYWEIMSSYNDWPSLFEGYKKYYNGLLTSFRKLAPLKYEEDHKK